MKAKLITDLPVKIAAANVLAEISMYAKHGMKQSKEQIAQIIADYSDNTDRTIEVSLLVWSRIKTVRS